MCALTMRGIDRMPGTAPFMSMELFERVLGQFPGARRIHLQGLGEPLLNPRFFAMAETAAGKGLEVSASSSLAFLDHRAARECATRGLHVLHVSIDGARATTYEAIRRGSSFRKLLANLDLLSRTREACGSGLPALRMTVVVMRMNLHELSRLVETASGLGMEEVFVQHLCRTFEEPDLPVRYAPMRAFVREQSLSGESPEKVAEAFGDARETADRLGVTLRLPNIGGGREKTGPRPPGCEWPWTGAYVSCDGTVMPCCMVPAPDRLNFGSLQERCFSDIWEGEAYRAFRERLSSPEPPDICLHCSVYSGDF